MTFSLKLSVVKKYEIHLVVVTHSTRKEPKVTPKLPPSFLLLSTDTVWFRRPLRRHGESTDEVHRDSLRGIETSRGHVGLPKC